MRLLCLFCLIYPAVLSGQNTIAFPDVTNYSKQTYQAGLQNWDIAQSRNGNIYIANNEGLLSFDGAHWQLYPLFNKTIVRSVTIATDNMIYVGGQDEIGYFRPASNGILNYVSLSELLPAKYRSFGDIWDIVSFNNDVFFRCTKIIIRLANGGFTCFTAPVEWSYMGASNGKLYSHDFQTGIHVFENEQWKPLFSKNPEVLTDPVTSILPFSGDTMIITTLKNGLFKFTPGFLEPFNSPDLQQIAGYRIYNAAIINKDWLMLATNKNGLHIINKKGELVQSFTKQEGLQNNNVLSSFADRDGNLWLGLDNGIDMVAYSNAIKKITPDGQDGAGYAALIYQNRLYAGTSGNLFSVPLQSLPDLSFSRGKFSAVGNTTGQIWALAEINGHLLLGHHEGPFEIRDNTASRLLSMAGNWNFIPLSAVNPSPVIVTGHYKGLQFFNYENGRFTAGKSLDGFNESSRFITIDNDDNIWVSHPYHGIYKVWGSGKDYHVELYKEDKGLPSVLNNHVYKIRNQVVFATAKGIYQYDPRSNRFSPAEFYQRLLGNQSIRYLKEDQAGNIWFIHEKNLGVLDMQGRDTSIVWLPEFNNKLNSGFEFIYPVDQRNIFIGGENGFFHINYEKYRNNNPKLSVQLSTIRISGLGDSILFGGYFRNVNEDQAQMDKPIPEISNPWRSIQFEFASPLFGQQSNLEYSYILKGLEDTWSPWNSRTEKEYTHLPPGKYSFEIRARNKPGNESPVYTFRFRILPPWYQTRWAYLGYLLLIVFAIYALIKWQQKKFERQELNYEEEQRKLQYLHQLEIDKAEAELVTLRNEKLQADIEFKNAELANSAMHLVQKGELLGKLRTELSRIMKVLDNETASAEIKKLIRTLSEDDKMESDWEHFTQHFDKVQRDFVTTLKEKHPGITPNELKLSAYLRMNLSTKEIAQLMNISVRGVEISRYRLRKKLGLPTGGNLFDYLMKM